MVKKTLDRIQEGNKIVVRKVNNVSVCSEFPIKFSIHSLALWKRKLFEEECFVSVEVRSMMTIANGKFVFQGKSWLINRANVVSATVGFFSCHRWYFVTQLKLKVRRGNDQWELVVEKEGS